MTPPPAIAMINACLASGGVAAHVISYDELGPRELLGYAVRGRFLSSRINAFHVACRQHPCGLALSGNLNQALDGCPRTLGGTGRRTVITSRSMALAASRRARSWMRRRAAAQPQAFCLLGAVPRLLGAVPRAGSR